MKSKRYKRTCKYCGFTWMAYHKNPKTCANYTCRTRRWQHKRIRKPRKK